MKFRFDIAFLLFFVLQLVSTKYTYACLKSKAPKDEPLELGMDTSRLTPYQNVKLQRTFIDANKEKIIGNYDKALKLFEQCIQKDPANDAAMYEVAQILMQKGQNVSALFFIKGAIKLKPNRTWYQLLYAEILENNNKFDEAAEIHKQLSKKDPYNYEHYLRLALAQTKGGHYKEAIGTYNQLEKLIGIEESISMQKQSLYLLLGNVNKAAEEIEKLIDAHPENYKYYGILAKLYENNNMPDKAKAIYDKLLKMDPDNVRTQLIIADYYKKIGDEESFENTLTKIFNSKEFNIDEKISLLFPYIKIFNPKDTARVQLSLNLAKILTQQHPKEAKSFAAYGDLLSNNNQSEDALKAYKKAINIDDSKFTVWQQIIFLQSDLQRNDSLIKYTDKAIELFPNQTILYFFNSVAKLQKKKYSDALPPTEKAIELGSDNKMLLAQLYSNLGDIYYNLAKHEASDSSFEASLAIDPDNAYVLNNYSYYLSLRNV